MKIEKFLGGLILVSGLVVGGTAHAQTAGPTYFEQVKELRAFAKNEAKLCSAKTLERLARAADKDPSLEDRLFAALEACLIAKEDHATAIANILYPEDGDFPDDGPPDGEE